MSARLALPWLDAHQEQGPNHGQEAQCVQEETPRWSYERNRKSRNRWTNRPRSIEDRGIQSNRVRQILLPHHLHEKSLPDWHVERVDDAYQKRDDNQLQLVKQMPSSQHL